jgi:hypothetical protein
VGARLDAARVAVDGLMQLATDLSLLTPGHEQFQPRFVELVAKARTARAALEGVVESGDEIAETPAAAADARAWGRDDQPEDGAKLRHERLGEDVKPSVKQPGGPASYQTFAGKPSKAQGGPRDGDQGPGEFKKAGVGGMGQIQRGMRPHCDQCGRLLDVLREDPCPLPDCPHPGPILPRAA